MIMSPPLRKLMLALHLTVSVGWIGAVMAYMALVLVGMNSRDDQLVSAVWISLKIAGWAVIVPCALASLVTGLVMALGTKWGLFRHYWVIFSLVLTIIAVTILIEHMDPQTLLVGTAFVMRSHDPGALRRAFDSELLHSGLGLLVLIVVQVLNIYKPKGITPYGWSKQQEQSEASTVESTA